MPEIIEFQECMAHQLYRDITKARNAGTVIAFIRLTENEWKQLQKDCTETPLLMEVQGMLTFAGIALQVDGQWARARQIMVPQANPPTG